MFPNPWTLAVSIWVRMGLLFRTCLSARIYYRVLRTAVAILLCQLLPPPRGPHGKRHASVEMPLCQYGISSCARPSPLHFPTAKYGVTPRVRSSQEPRTAETSVYFVVFHG